MLMTLGDERNAIITLGEQIRLFVQSDKTLHHFNMSESRHNQAKIHYKCNNNGRNATTLHYMENRSMCTKEKTLSSSAVCSLLAALLAEHDLRCGYTNY